LRLDELQGGEPGSDAGGTIWQLSTTMGERDTVDAEGDLRGAARPLACRAFF
jgi:hypothetical protein